jgi:hypothetical protein
MPCHIRDGWSSVNGFICLLKPKHHNIYFSLLTLFHWQRTVLMITYDVIDISLKFYIISIITPNLQIRKTKENKSGQ